MFFANENISDALYGYDSLLELDHLNYAEANLIRTSGETLPDSLQELLIILRYHEKILSGSVVQTRTDYSKTFN